MLFLVSGCNGSKNLVESLQAHVLPSEVVLLAFLFPQRAY